MLTHDLLLDLHKGYGGLGVAHQVPDLDAFLGRGGNPLVLGVESQLADLAVVVELSGVLRHVGHIPDLDTLSTAGGGQVLAIGADGHGVDVLIMMLERASDLEVGVPNLNSSVPSDRAEVGVVTALLILKDRGVSDTADPILMVAILRGEFVLTSGVPKSDTRISSGRDDLSVIRGERAGEDFLLMSDEESLSLTGLKVP